MPLFDTTTQFANHITTKTVNTCRQNQDWLLFQDVVMTSWHDHYATNQNNHYFKSSLASCQISIRGLKTPLNLKQIDCYIVRKSSCVLFVDSGSRKCEFLQFFLYDDKFLSYVLNLLVTKPHVARYSF